MHHHELISTGAEQSRGRRKILGSAVAVALASMVTVPSAHAFELNTGNPDLKVRWDNTLKYNAASRLESQSPAITAGTNLDDGDRNFNKGLISNRLDLLSEFDAIYKDVGLRLSGAAWYDAVYNRANNNNSPFTANSLSVPNNEFTSSTQKLHGKKGELLDAFVFGKTNFGDDKAATFRLGKHSLLWGESLFFGANGIAGGQAPVDIIKLLSVPGSQFKEIIRPVDQVSGQLQLSPNLSVGAYYQYRWDKTRIPAAGSYLSSTDVLDAGGERLLAGAPVMPGGGPLAFFRGKDIEARDSGQGGVQVKFRPEQGDAEYGLYAIRYHSKTPQVYLRPAGFNPVSGQIGDYVLVFPENILAYGASFTTSLGPVNVGGEASVRRNTPLVNSGVVANGTADNRDNPLYPVGNSAHAQMSAIYLLTPTSLWQGGSLLAEVAWHRRTSITKNPGALDPNTTRDAWGFRLLFEPAYYQVLEGLDIKVPIGLGYNPRGRSSVISQFNGGVDKGGDASIGLTGEYLKVWKFGLNYTHFLGTAGTYFTPPNSATPKLSFDQPLKDRNFVSFSVQRTF